MIRRSAAFDHAFAMHVKTRREPASALRRLSNSDFGWLLWNPILKWHNRTWGLPPTDGQKPYLNGKPAPHLAQSIFSVCGWGWFRGFRQEVDEDGRKRLATAPGVGAIPCWMFGRVSLRKD